MVTLVLLPFHGSRSLAEKQGKEQGAEPRGRAEYAAPSPARREAEAGGLQPAAEEVRTFLHRELGPAASPDRLCPPLAAHYRSGV